MPSFGWIPTTPEHQPANDRWRISRLGLMAPDVVEVSLIYPNYVAWYDQGNVGACVGYSCSWQMSIYNNPHKYNASWLYRQAKIDDGDPATDPNRDTGAYLWAGMDVLKKRGHCLDKTTTPVPAEGIESYYWCRTIDDIRTAFSISRPVVFGISWYSEFSSPRTVNGEFWIGTRSSWGSVLGGHAICAFACSDSRQAVRLLNTWGAGYPPVWIGYKSIEKLFTVRGECAAAVDRGAPPPPPPPPPPTQDTVTVTVGGVRYAGELKRV